MEDLGIDGNKIINRVCGCGLGPTSGCHERGIEPLGSVEIDNFLIR
jgi:hypothetical protein